MIIISFKMAGFIPIFIAEEDEESRERVFSDRRDPLDCFDDFELVQRYRSSRSAILRIRDLLKNH